MNVCDAARGHLTTSDRAFALAYQQLDREAALALAGLGRLKEAEALCDALLTECLRHDHPLARGLLHCDRARIACIAADREMFSTHAEAARTLFVSLQNPALVMRVRRLLEQGRAAGLIAELSRDSRDEGDLSICSTLESARANRVLERQTG